MPRGGGYCADLVVAGFGEPDVAVRPGRDPGRGGAPVEGHDIENGSGRRHAANRVEILLGEPEIPVRPGRDPGRAAARKGRGIEFGEHTGRRHPGDLIPAEFGEPDIAIRPGSDAVWLAPRWD